jgi:hypothetical protein
MYGIIPFSLTSYNGQHNERVFHRTKYHFLKVSAVFAQASVGIGPNLPFGVSILTDVAMAAVAGSKNIPLPFSIPVVSGTSATEDAAQRRRR